MKQNILIFLILHFVYAPRAFTVLFLRMCFTLVFLLHVQINMSYLLKCSFCIHIIESEIQSD